MPLVGSFFSKSYTATDDLIFQVENEDIWLSSTNIQCFTNDCYNGNTYLQVGVIRANAVKWFEGKVCVADLWFKNYTPGSNTTIVVEGIICSPPTR
jgi:hypothetical protein